MFIPETLVLILTTACWARLADTTAIYIPAIISFRLSDSIAIAFLWKKAIRRAITRNNVAMALAKYIPEKEMALPGFVWAARFG